MLQIELPLKGMEVCEKTQVAAVVEGVLEEFHLLCTQRTTLATKAGSLHWHLRPVTEKKGVLEVTYWPRTGQVWVEIHENRQQLWNVAMAQPFSHRLTEQLQMLSSVPHSNTKS